VVLYVGGNYNQNQNYGLFYLNGNNDATDKYGNIGGRHLVKKDIYSTASRTPLGEDITDWAWLSRETEKS